MSSVEFATMTSLLFWFLALVTVAFSTCHCMPAYSLVSAAFAIMPLSLVSVAIATFHYDYVCCSLVSFAFATVTVLLSLVLVTVAFATANIPLWLALRRLLCPISLVYLSDR